MPLDTNDTTPISDFEEMWLPGPYKTRFYARTYAPAATPARGVLVFLHGFIEHVGRYQHVFPLWAARGIAVFAFDQRGFGRTAEDREQRSSDSSYGKTSGPQQNEDVEWAVGAARAKFGKELPVFLMGHSMGGCIALDYPTSKKTDLAGVIASSPLIALSSPVSRVTRWAGGKAATLMPYMTVSAPVKAEDLSHDPAVCEQYIKDPLVKQQGTLRGIADMLNRGEELIGSHIAAWDPELPVLCIHGQDDKVNSCAATQQFHDRVAAKDKVISLYPGGFHELHNEPDGVKEKFIEECITWVERHLPSPASNT